MTEATKTGVTIVPKISIKTMGAKPDMVKVLDEDNARWPLIRLMGIARGIKSATGNNGDPVFGLTGQFEAVNIKSGERSISGVAYLPGGILELIMDPVEAILNGEDKAAKQAGVKFAMDLFSVKASNPAGYSFSADNLVAASTVDPLGDLRDAIGTTKLPALPKS